MHAREDRDKDAVGPGVSRPAVPKSAAESAGGLLALQRTAGNAAVTATIAAQRHQHDANCGHMPAMQRAEADADQETHVHGADCGHGEQAVQRRAEADEHVRVQRRSSVYDAIASPSQGLEPQIQQKAEKAYGMRLSHVRVHSGPVAQRSAKEHGAHAYTTGDHIVLGAPRVDSETMYHEIGHIRQQSLGPVAGTDNGSGAKVSHPGDPFEVQAKDNGRKVDQGVAPDLSMPGSGAAVQRTTEGAAEADVSVQRSPVVTRAHGSHQLIPAPPRGANGTTGNQFLDTHVVPHAANRRSVSNPWHSNFAVLLYIDNSTGQQHVADSFNAGQLGPHSEEALFGHLNNQQVDFTPVALFTDRIPCGDCTLIIGPAIAAKANGAVPVYYITAAGVPTNQQEIRAWWQ
ncbi:DUF4157 domain-containing protein [Streptomyces sp. GbtcB6]|uniref:eCIS core domain-containing protein n=1 Tax=Streptomyces sp. GbtcB6 TaxID=2824751 RepID=UPI001C2FD768|nr:DUF4157 domain-containing protein [Streptomyces sp. GbtcB6]